MNLIDSGTSAFMTPSQPGILYPDTAVLIVDDSLQYAGVLTKMLTHGFGFQNITHIDSSTKALEQLTATPDVHRLLFVDFHFPCGFTGGELLQALRERKILDGKVAFLITSEPSSENIKKAIQAGAYGVVAKPFDRKELQKQLEKAHRTLVGETVESF